MTMVIGLELCSNLQFLHFHWDVFISLCIRYHSNHVVSIATIVTGIHWQPRTSIRLSLVAIATIISLNNHNCMHLDFAQKLPILRHFGARQDGSIQIYRANVSILFK